MGILLRWVLPIALSAVLGWFSINKVTGTFSKAAKADELQLEIDALKITHASQIEQLTTGFNKTVEQVQAKSEARDIRREEWRQAYYNEVGKNGTKRNDETKEWGTVTYPDELD